MEQGDREGSEPPQGEAAGPRSGDLGRYPAADYVDYLVASEQPLGLAANPPLEASQQPALSPVPRRRRVKLPIALFVATCCSTFFIGLLCAGNLIRPVLPDELANQMTLWERLAYGWPDALLYMGSVMGILLAHEMGHFLQAVRYRVPASLPHFIPMPVPPIGTMGAVIFMPSSQANRRELFDIGLSGPLAGLVIALPVAWLGILWAGEVTVSDGLSLQDPLLFRPLVRWLHPNLHPGQDLLLNPLLLAGWVGMLITGLNMLPVSQLDGGHVAYALFGRRAHWLARAVMLVALVFIVVSGHYEWIVMLALVTYIGPSHPPTADDYIPLGWFRRLLGVASLAIPIFCFVPVPIRVVETEHPHRRVQPADEFTSVVSPPGGGTRS